MPASGLVTALEPILRACDGTWIAQATGDADRETADEHDRVRVPPDIRNTRYAASGSTRRRRRVSTSASPTKDSGRSAISRTRGPIFRAEDWEHTRR